MKKDDLQFGVVTAPVASTDAFELADFETPLTTTPVPQVVWSIEKHRVAQMLGLEGKSKAQVSRETGVPVATITKWQQHPEFREYINRLVLESAGEMKAKRLSLLTKILDARIAEAEATGDYARLSKLDTLDVIAAIRKETGEDEKKEESKYIQVMDKLLGKIPDAPKPPQAIDITPSASSPE